MGYDGFFEHLGDDEVFTRKDSDVNSVDTIRQKWQRGQVVLGTSVMFADPGVSELVCQAGIDFIFIDLEHGALSLHQAMTHVMVARGADVPVFIRVASHDPVVIKPVLDIHPAGIIIPRITNAQEVATAISGCKYPPKGNRGYGPMRGVRYGDIDQKDYLKHADSQTMILVQIEDIQAVNDLDAILATPGLDSIMIGPNDLSGSLNLLGQVSHPDVVQAMDTVIEKCHAAEVPVGIAGGYDPALVRTMIEKGLSWMSLNGDWGSMFKAMRAMVDEFHQIEKGV